MARDDIPVAVEILDDDGTVIATGERVVAEPRPSSDGELGGNRRGVPFKLLGIGAAALGAAALILALTRTDDDAPAEDAAPFVAGETIDVGSRLPAPTFPLFGREWDVELLGQTLTDTLVALDLNTGETRDMATLDVNRGTTRGAVSIDGTLYVNTGDKIQRVDETNTVVIHEAPPARSGDLVLIGYYFSDQFLFSETATLTHLHTRREVEIPGVTTFNAVGDDIFAAKGGKILVIDADGLSRHFADGELLTSGRTGVTWRECRGIDECSYWSGRADDPRIHRLDPDAAERALTLAFRTPTGAAGLFGSVDLLSPSLRLAVTIEDISVATRDLPIVIIDLLSGESVRIEGATTPPTFGPDDSVLFFPGDAGDVIAVDTTTGESTRVDLPEGAFPFFEIVLVPSN